MFFNEAKQMLRTYLSLRPRSPENSKKVFSRQGQLRTGAQPDAFQRAVIVFTIVLAIVACTALILAKAPY